MVSYIQVFSEEQLCSQRLLQPWLEVSPSPPADEAGCPLPSPLWRQICVWCYPTLEYRQVLRGEIKENSPQKISRSFEDPKGSLGFGIPGQAKASLSARRNW